MFNEQYPIEMFRRAFIERDVEAWAWVQHTCFETVLTWLRNHPKSKEACRLVDEPTLVSQAFQRLWQATAENQRLAQASVAVLLQYLYASLNSVVLDTLRVSSRTHRVSVAEVWLMKDVQNAGSLWQTIMALLPDGREQRLAYLLYHCGLKPKEIVSHCPQEFSDLQEVLRLRRKIVECLLQHEDAVTA